MIYSKVVFFQDKCFIENSGTLISINNNSELLICP